MAKIVIIGDMHIGARNSNKTVEKWQNKFFDDLFFPYLKEHNIKHVFQLGDFFDNRKWLNVQSIDNMIDHVIKPSQELGLDWKVLVGNHDIPLKNTLKGHTPGIMLKHYPEFSVIDKPETVDIDGVNFTFVPWICKENEDDISNVIKHGGDIILGHFEVAGAVMHPGAISHDGIAQSDFNKWKCVWSGHYHTQSLNGNIHYLGTPYQMSWSDATTKHGFWVYDTTDDSFEFVENKFRYFHRLYWNDGCNHDLSTIADGYVKITVQKKTDFEIFERFIDKVNFNSPFELKVIESYEEYNQENVQDLIKVSTTEELIGEYIDEVATNTSKESIKDKMLQIYHEAMSIEE